MTGPVGPAPGWHVDPSGRHQLRWWDGSTFTDQVADAGAVTTDPGVAPAYAAAPPTPAAMSDFIVVPKPRRQLPLVLAAVGAVLVVGAGAFLLLRDDGGGGFGTFEGVVEGDDGGAVHEISVPAGSLVVVEVDPDNDLDVQLGFAVDDETSDHYEELFEDLEGDDPPGPLGPLDADDRVDLDDVDLGDRESLWFSADVLFTGESETMAIAAPFAVSGSIVVSGFDDSEGSYEITIERFELDVDEDDDGDEVLEALADSRDVPNDLQDFFQNLLDQRED
ncbi:MAG: DUF2510 domain-containing protein [Acidimicrobiales bacterium]